MCGRQDLLVTEEMWFCVRLREKNKWVFVQHLCLQWGADCYGDVHARHYHQFPKIALFHYLSLSVHVSLIYSWKKHFILPIHCVDYPFQIGFSVWVNSDCPYLIWPNAIPKLVWTMSVYYEVKYASTLRGQGIREYLGDKRDLSRKCCMEKGVNNGVSEVSEVSEVSKVFTMSNNIFRINSCAEGHGKPRQLSKVLLALLPEIKQHRWIREKKYWRSSKLATEREKRSRESTSVHFGSAILSAVSIVHGMRIGMIWCWAECATYIERILSLLCLRTTALFIAHERFQLLISDQSHHHPTTNLKTRCHVYKLNDNSLAFNSSRRRFNLDFPQLQEVIESFVESLVELGL